MQHNPIIKGMPNELEQFRSNLEKLDDLVKVQGVSGNWDYDGYMHGMYNGLILSMSVIEIINNEPLFRDAPESGYLHIPDDEKLRQKYPVLKSAYEEYLLIKELLDKE